MDTAKDPGANMRLDHDDGGARPSESMSVIDAHESERDVVGKPMPTFRHHGLAGDRRAGIDIARGLAVGGMVLFHLDWDLAYWGWIDTGPADSPLVMAFGHTVAATFLFISGLCLALARRRGLRAAMRRIGLLTAAALLVTAVTWWLFPSDFIFFGILHCIAATNLIGLAFLDAPAWSVVAVSLAAALAPTFASSSHFDGPAWWWLGLSVSAPTTLDYRPLLPWLSPVLLGIAAARLIRGTPRLRPAPRWTAGISWAGRHSLSLYVLHQPVLFALFFLLGTLHPAPVASQETAFAHACLRQCVAAGAGRAGCEAACSCVLRHVSQGLTATGAAPSPSEVEGASTLCLHPAPSGP